MTEDIFEVQEYVLFFLAEDIFVPFPPLQYVELVAGKWNRRGSSCLWASSFTSPWACRSNLNLKPNPNLNPNLNTKEMHN